LRGAEIAEWGKNVYISVLMPKLAFIFLLSLALLSGCGKRSADMIDVRPSDGAGDTAAIQSAIDHADGGSVRLLAGTYHSGALHLHDHITFIIDSGATLIASTNPDDFPVAYTRYEGAHQQAYAPLLSAENATGISIVGNGTIDGAGKIWWDRSLDKAHPLPYPRPRLVEFLHCTDVAVRGITLKNAPCWCIHPVYCNNVIVDGVTITAPSDSPNTDGVDPDSSTNVSITHCTFDCGDDCIAIKSGKDAEGRAENLPSRDITISNCTMLHGIAGVGIGSEMSGGVYNVNVSDCTFGIRIKTRRGRGGSVHDLSFKNLTMNDLTESFELTAYFWETGDKLPPAPVSEETPTIRDISFENITSNDCQWAGKIDGLPERLFSNISLTNVKISADNGMYLRYATGLKFQNVQVDAETGPPFIVEHVEDSAKP
jgi:polygalacturonase